MINARYDNDVNLQAAQELMSPHCQSTLEEITRRPGVHIQYLFGMAARSGLVDKMQQLFSKYGAKINKQYDTELYDSTTTVVYPLISAVSGHSVAAVDWLLRHGADPDVGDVNNVRPLWLAAQDGSLRIAKLLLGAGANMNTAIKSSTGNSALYMAVQNDHKPMVRFLLTHGADKVLLHRENHQKFTPLFIAIGSMRNSLVAQLVNAGAEVSTMQMVILQQIRSTKQLITTDRQRTVTDEELDEAEEMILKNRFHPLLQGANKYSKAQRAERRGDYRLALSLYQKVMELCISQDQTDYSREKVPALLRYDIDRNIDAIYGVKGSDGRASIWKQVPIMSPACMQPPKLQFEAWTQVGRKIYIHGGKDFVSCEWYPTVDEVWVFDIDSREWSQVNVDVKKGNTPGPRAGHTMFEYKNALYVWGGQGTFGVNNSKLHRLSLDGISPSRKQAKPLPQPLVWEVVKLKSSAKPSPRENHAGVLYQGKYYVSCGELPGQTLSDDLWCLNLSNMKWSMLKSGPKKRLSHGMWAAHDKIYLLGGRTYEKDPVTEKMKCYTINDFHSYDIKDKEWKRLETTGDKPFDIAEFTVLPLYDDQDQDKSGMVDCDPYSIIIYGGFNEKYPINIGKEEMVAKYGDHVSEFRQAYIRRLLRFDLDTQVWTLLEAQSELLPKALSFGAKLETKNGQTQLLIGGGYGFTQNSKQGSSHLEHMVPELFGVSQEEAEMTTCPENSEDIFEVYIADTKDLCTVKEDMLGKGWAWELFDSPSDRTPTTHINLSPCSPTLHLVIDLTHEDFMEPKVWSVKENDESNLLGVRVKLQGLKARQDLNGQVARCGCWLEDRERYQIFFSAYQKGGPASMAVKASNLLVAKPYDIHSGGEIAQHASSCTPGHAASFSNVSFSMGIPGKGGKKRSPLDCIGRTIAPSNVTMMSDTYHGPVSAAAQSILRTVAEKKSAFKSTLQFIYLNLSEPDSTVENEENKYKDNFMKRLNIFTNFYTNLKEKDSDRVQKMESAIADVRENGSFKVRPLFRIEVTLDAVRPEIRRELIVSSDITMQNLYHQVLCPAIGWTNNYHCYAFRRMIEDETFDPKISSERKEETSKKGMKMQSEECWIGPKVTTAIDR
jgi:hypothetical protein